LPISDCRLPEIRNPQTASRNRQSDR